MYIHSHWRNVSIFDSHTLSFLRTHITKKYKSVMIMYSIPLTWVCYHMIPNHKLTECLLLALRVGLHQGQGLGPRSSASQTPLWPYFGTQGQRLILKLGRIFYWVGIDENWWEDDIVLTSLHFFNDMDGDPNINSLAWKFYF